MLHQETWLVVCSLAGMVVAQLAVPRETTPFLIAIAWLEMALLLSRLGNREALKMH